MTAAFELSVRVEFPAAHHIVGYDGDCARPHGHNWEMEVFVRANRVGPVGIAVDFRDVKRTVMELVGRWDHQDLNTLSEFAKMNPTAETMAMVAYDALAPRFQTAETELLRVRIWENKRLSATYGKLS